MQQNIDFLNMMIIQIEAGISCKHDPTQWKCSEQVQKYVRPFSYILCGLSVALLLFVIFMFIHDYLEYGFKKTR